MLQSLKQDPFTGTEDDFAYQGKPRKKRAGIPITFEWLLSMYGIEA